MSSALLEPVDELTRRRLLGAAGSVSVGLMVAGCGSDPAGTAAAKEGPFPVTIEHAFGSAEIPAAPPRVVSVGYSDQDAILALGVVPVGLRDWFGDQPNAVWPWAQPLLGGAAPEVLPLDALNFEAIAALEPDLIVGRSTFDLTSEEYETLSRIALTVGPPAGGGTERAETASGA